jgi:hypothetical protein
MACLFSKLIRDLERTDLAPRLRWSRGFAPDIPMVKSSDARKAADPGAIRGPGIDGSPGRRITKRGMDALRVVVLDVLPKQASQMVLVEHDHMIEQLPPNAADEALRRPVLPGAAECRSVRKVGRAKSGMRLELVSQLKPLRSAEFSSLIPLETAWLSRFNLETGIARRDFPARPREFPVPSLREITGRGPRNGWNRPSRHGPEVRD